MFKNILEMFKYPVTNTLQKAQNAETKAEVIRLVILSAITSLITIIQSIIVILTMKYYKFDDKLEMIKKAKLISTFFWTFVVLAIIIAVIALIMFVVSKLVKDKKNYSITLSMVNNVFIYYLLGNVVNCILSFIYAPLGEIVMLATIIFAAYTLVLAFRESLMIENSDKFVLFTVMTIMIAIVAVIILYCVVYGVSLKDLSGFSTMLKYLY